MGLFSSVIHVRDTGAEAVCEALAEVVPEWNFRLSEQRATTGPPREASRDALLYFVSPLRGSWSTILEGHFVVPDGPGITHVAKSLSGRLGTYTLALMVHDDDVLYYHLSREGAEVDSYDSNPQYFENERVSDDAIAEQRHDPSPFAALLPDGVTLAELKAVLDRGWWSAYNEGRLDADGVQPDDEAGFVFEGERMIAIGNLLQLHGSADGYPFAGWASDPSINWGEYYELRFEPA